MNSLVGKVVYALVKGFELDLGKIIKESILDCIENNFSGNILYPSLMTFLCIKGGVKFDEAKEKSPKVATVPREPVPFIE